MTNKLYEEKVLYYELRVSLCDVKIKEKNKKKIELNQDNNLRLLNKRYIFYYKWVGCLIPSRDWFQTWN